MAVVTRIPSMVARGIVFSGLATLPEGMVAHSNPRNAKNVKVAVAEMAAKSDTPLMLKGRKFFNRMKNKPPIATASRGTILIIVVTNCNLPDVTMPSVLTQVSSQMAPNPVNMANKVLVARAGKKVLNALTIETAMAALVHQIEIQYPQATRKPAKSPSPLRE